MTLPPRLWPGPHDSGQPYRRVQATKACRMLEGLFGLQARSLLRPGFLKPPFSIQDAGTVFSPSLPDDRSPSTEAVAGNFRCVAGQCRQIASTCDSISFGCLFF